VKNYIIELIGFQLKNAAIIRVVVSMQSRNLKWAKAPKFGGENVEPGAICCTLLKNIDFRLDFCSHRQGSCRREVWWCAPVPFGIDTSITLHTLHENLKTVSRDLWLMDHEWSKSQWVRESNKCIIILSKRIGYRPQKWTHHQGGCPVQSGSQEMGKRPQIRAEKLVPEAFWATLKNIGFRLEFLLPSSG